MSRTIILACGNPLRGDDGIAWHIARCLQRGYGDAETEICCAQQWTPELAERISKASLAIFVDASAALPPGKIRLQPVSSSKDSPGATTHSLSPAQLLTLADELYERVPERAFLLTIGGASFEHGDKLSPLVRLVIPKALAQIRALVSGVTWSEPGALPPSVN